MIKINLLPQQKRAKTTNVEKDVVLFVLGIFFIAAFIIVVDYYFSWKSESLRVAVQEKNQIKSELQKSVGHVNAVMSELKDIEGRIAIIKDIRMRQGLPVKYIDEIVINIPQNKMWVETFTINDSGSISMSGVALDNQAFASYVEKLRTSKYIASVNTQRTSRRSIDGLGLIAFQCTVAAKAYFENLDTNGTKNG